MEETSFQYKNFNYSLNADKLLNVKDGEVNGLLKTFNITDNILKDMIEEIRSWYLRQPHLPQGELHDRMIIGQLISRGFSVEQSKEKIEKYFAARHRMPDLLMNREPLSEDSIKYLKEGYWIISPLKTPENYRVVIFRILNPDMIVLDVTRLGLLISDYKLFNDNSQGEHWVFDFGQATLNHTMQLNPLMVTNIYYYITSCFAPKLKGFHFVNVPSFAQPILLFFKKVIKVEHASRLHLYDSFDDVLKVLPKDVFPNDLGGTSGLTCQEIAYTWYETLQSDTWKAFFKHQDATFLTDESKRLPSSQNTAVFGINGSFRKLDVD